ncbi:hypothetical protein EVAR_30606_1 [Eumeta japonica]|uniref:Uncharacterized protein n=1 Tax=Eumeta variegata TaxID=151549 RepID=A0A4C1W828_EUMVA|nr:hypothetical protein EVAR_30606_1 [Eumeta japonica]
MTRNKRPISVRFTNKAHRPRGAQPAPLSATAAPPAAELITNAGPSSDICEINSSHGPARCEKNRIVWSSMYTPLLWPFASRSRMHICLFE